MCACCVCEVRSRSRARCTISTETNDTLRGLKDKLNEPNHKNIHERTRKKRVDYETTQMAEADLAKYGVALDKALMQFHSTKIGEINRIIRELWQRTYRGEDIDTIEVFIVVCKLCAAHAKVC